MSLYNKIIWSEGMFLHPIHFQQQDAYFEDILHRRCNTLLPYGWGVTDLEIDDNLLLLGKLNIKKCSGIFPDGTYFNMPLRDKVSLCIDVPIDTENCIVYLALPFKLNTPEIGVANVAGNFSCRYKAYTANVTDHNEGADSVIPIELGQLSLQLLLENQDGQHFNCIGIARIAEVRFDKKIILDEHYIPPCLNMTATSHIFSLVQELQNMLNYRGEVLSARLTDAGTGGISEISDFLLLQIINRYKSLLTHFIVLEKIHPEQLYQVLVQLAGEMATFDGWQRRPIPMPRYVHDDLQSVFWPIMVELRRLLSILLEESVVTFDLEEQEANTWIARLHDKTCLENFNFVLAIYSHVSQENLRMQFPAQIKVAPIEEMRDLVQRALPGIDLQALAVAPRQIPYHANFVYFLLNQQHTLWKNLKKSAGLAFQVGGVFPGLRLELWAIKDKCYE